MPTPRQGLMCGPIRSQSGGPVEKVVVSGGWGLSKVEVYNVGEDSWEIANDLPFGVLHSAEVVSFEDTFLIMGGEDDDVPRDEVWKYHKNDTWEEMDHLKLSETKMSFAAIAVPSDIFPKC